MIYVGLAFIYISGYFLGEKKRLLSVIKLPAGVISTSAWKE